MADFEELAEAAGLEYVFDDTPGHRRLRRGEGFVYLDPTGEAVDEATRDWIRGLAIPPAWTEVWIAPSPRSHILATGRDKAGRKQYLYHPDWSDAAGDLKFSRMRRFARHLPSLRRRVEEDLRRHILDREKVSAIAVRVLDQTLIRVGNRRYAVENGSFGLTTLESDHVLVEGQRVEFEFTGKGGAEHTLTIHDRHLASLVTRCQDLDGETLFSFQDGDQVISLTPVHLNDYIADLSRDRFTAKDFRTWGASATVTEAMATATSDLLEAIDIAAERLGNTRTVCRASYVHPVIDEAATDGRLDRAWRRSRDGRWLNRAESALRRLVSEDA
ncbi:MAG TPA: DNA topoisomerase IB [Acidimicrobiia bacterium]